MPFSHDERTPQDILRTIAADFQRATAAEKRFIAWEASHKNATCDDFASHFDEWLLESFPYARSRHLIEERYPDYIEDMEAALSGCVGQGRATAKA